MKFTSTAEFGVVMVPVLLCANHSTIRSHSEKQQFCLHTKRANPWNKLFCTFKELNVHSDLAVWIQSLKSEEISEKLVIFWKTGLIPRCRDITELQLCNPWIKSEAPETRQLFSQCWPSHNVEETCGLLRQLHLVHGNNKNQQNPCL